MSHFNYVHCGVEILSMSKRIMNKVFCCADDVGVKIYYQYTDIIHLNYDDVPKLVERYQQTCNQELVGEYDLLSSKEVKKVNFISRLIKSINYLIWGDV